MSRRSWFVTRLHDDNGVSTLVGDRIQSVTRNQDPDPNMETPFIVVRAGIETPGMGRVTQQRFYTYAHVDPMSPLMADEILAAVKAALRLAGPEAHETGHIMACEWESDSEDLFDDGFGTTTRFATHRVTSSQ